MKRSETRILTTHVGSLPRPKDLIELYQQDAPDSTLLPRLKSAVAEVVNQQAGAGIDIVNDGEFGKAMRRSVDYGAWWSYIYDRIAGLRSGKLKRRKAARRGRLAVRSARNSLSSTGKMAAWVELAKPLAAAQAACSGWFAPALSITPATPSLNATPTT